MASPELAIAKAALSATLFRADPTSLSRAQVDAFFPLLSTAVSQCSRPNVQKCKAWIVANVAPSPGRSAALGKFLVAFSKDLQQQQQQQQQRPSTKRRRLHILYVLNDVLHHEVVRRENVDFGAAWAAAALPALFASAAAFDSCPKHIKKLEDLLALWQEKRYLPEPAIAQIRESLANGPAVDNAQQPSQPSQTSLKLAKDAPYLLPSLHGDPASPWYDLPAATWLPHLTPNSTKPMVPDLVRPIRLAQGPADSKLAGAVKSLLADVERMFSKQGKGEDDPHVDLSELGERVVVDEVTGEIVAGETYYGWSRQFSRPVLVALAVTVLFEIQELLAVEVEIEIAIAIAKLLPALLQASESLVFAFQKPASQPPQQSQSQSQPEPETQREPKPQTKP